MKHGHGRREAGADSASALVAVTADDAYNLRVCKLDWDSLTLAGDRDSVLETARLLQSRPDD